MEYKVLVTMLEEAAKKNEPKKRPQSSSAGKAKLNTNESKAMRLDGSSDDNGSKYSSDHHADDLDNNDNE